MTKVKDASSSRAAGGDGCGCFRVEAVLSVDERGQMVLPKEIRERAGIGPGDKLTLITWERDGAVCCLSLMKADHFSEMAKGVLGPMFQGGTSA